MNYIGNTYNYNSYEIRTTVDVDNQKEFFLCASDIEKIFPIYTVESYLKLEETKQLISEILSSNCKNQPTDEDRVVKIVSDGNFKGIWFCRALSLDYCRWISLKLFVWCESVCNRMASKLVTQRPKKNSLYSTTEVIKYLDGDWKVKDLLEDLEKKNIIKFNKSGKNRTWTMSDKRKLHYIKEKKFTIGDTGFSRPYNVWTEEGKNYLISLYRK